MIAFIGLYCHVSAQGSEIATITLPKEASKLNKQDASTFVHNQFKRPIFFRSQNNIFKVGNIVIEIHDDANMQDQDSDLQLQKLQTESFIKKYGGHIIDSRIAAINNINFYINKQQDGDDMVLYFMSDFKDKKVVACTVYYKKTDESKARSIFDNILNSVHYKQH